MKTKRILRDEITRLNYRIEELEEKICPYNQHQWIHVGASLFDKVGCYYETSICKYKCKKCGKEMQTTDIIVNLNFDECEGIDDKRRSN